MDVTRYTTDRIVAACKCLGGGSNCPIIGCISSGYISSPGITRPEQCSQICAATSGCLSYQVGPNGNSINCNLMSISAQQAWYPENPVDDYCKQYSIYDLSCPAPTTCPACTSQNTGS